MTKLYIVVPCYNEEEVLPITSKRLAEKLTELTERGVISPESRVLMVDDGSRDATWRLITELHERDARFCGAKLSRNRGHQNALLAGLMTAKTRCDCAVSMDADLQDDVDAVDEMLARFEEGCDVVYGVRSARETDTAFKRSTAQWFYKLINAMGGELVYDHADYRLLSRRALEALSEYGEANLFLRGIVPMMGYKSAKVEYRRGERAAGESKYPLKKMLAFAWEGITSLTARPITLMMWLGAAMAALAALVCVVLAVLDELEAAGAIICALAFFSGVNLFGTGLVGQYVGKTYMESKHRPRYFIEEIVE
ncbi:MAG TPA: glycosyltransferase family 2 protein [Firmicutes bacterium]|nr:glycosyltransferase family 2 protein [Bacillota bacterium]